MHQQPTDSATEVKRLQRCVNDLISVLALPTVWNGSGPSRILDTFLDALLVMLGLDFLYARVRFDSHEAPIDALRTAQLYGTSHSPEEIRQALDRWFGEGSRQSTEVLLGHLGGQEVSVFPIRMGVEGELGLIVSGSQRAGFPELTESLVLSVAANQLAIGLQQALLLSEQKRVANELDLRVKERTRELAETNRELQLQVGLLQLLPVSAWTLNPDGTPDFVNQVWLEFSGQTLEFVRSNPEAWMTAVHPEDRARAAKSFWEGVSAGKDFAFENRTLRANDGTYRWHLSQAVVLRDGEGKVLKFVGTTADIHDQKLAEEELRASEAKLRRVIDTIPSLSWCNLPDGPNEFLSKGWHDYTGMSPEEAHGWGWSGSFHPDDLPPLMNRWQELLVSGEPGEIEARIRRHDGEYRWFLIRVAPFRDETGAILRWYGTSTDIHDRKLADEALRTSEAQLRLIIDSTPGFLGVLGPAGEVEFVSRQNWEYFGLVPEQLKGWRTIDIVHPDDLPRAIAKFTHSLTTGTPFFDEHRYRRADGEYRWFDVRVYPARDTQGRITRWFTFSIDVHDRKLAVEALRASENNLRQTVNSLPGLICTMSPAGEIEELNQPLLEYFGKTPKELKGWRMTDAVHPDDLPEVIKAYTYSITNGAPYEIEHRCRRADGVYRWFQVRASAVRDADEHITGWYVLLTDIEDRKRAEDALRASETNLREILDSIPGLVCTLSPAGEMELTNRPFLEYFGKTLEELKDWGNSDAVHPDDMPGVVLEFTNSIRTGAPYYTEHRCRRADGVYRWFQNSAIPMRDTEGRISRWYCLITDIDDRKHAEDELKRSEARHRVVVETASDAVVSIDEGGAIIFANPATKRIFGYSPEELIGKPLTVLMPGAMRKLHETGFKRYLETGAKHLNWQGTEVTALRANGEEFPAEVSFGEMVTNHRKVFTGFIRDISEKKRSEEAILASERNLSLIINTMPVLAWSARPDGAVEFFNRRWLDYTGLSPEQARGWGWADALHPDDLNRVTEYWQSLMTTGGPGEIEARLRHFDGDYRWFLFRADPMRDDSDAIVKWYGTNTDIDGRKRAEEALRIRELNLLQITETIPEMLWSASPGGAIEYCNGRLLDYTGISLEQVMSDGWMTFLHPDDVEPTAEVWKSCVKNGTPYKVEVRAFHAADRTYRWCVTSALPLLDHEGRIVKWHGTVVDMHDWKKAQEELRNTQAELARVTRVLTIGQLTASIAHEVSQPLSGIITNASTCLRMLRSDPPNVDGAQETVQRTIRDGKRASEVITRLRTLFSKKPIQAEMVDLNEAIREVIGLLAGELQRNNVILKPEFSDHLPTVNGDRVQLQQVILNLLHNGSDAMATIDGRPRLLLIRTEADCIHVTVSVQDSGIGFSSEISERLFEPFFTTKQEGMGIGLSVCRSIVEAHRGRLWAVRNAGPGATFAFSIPQDAENPDPAE